MGIPDEMNPMAHEDRPATALQATLQERARAVASQVEEDVTDAVKDVTSKASATFDAIEQALEQIKDLPASKVEEALDALKDRLVEARRATSSTALAVTGGSAGSSALAVVRQAQASMAGDVLAASIEAKRALKELAAIVSQAPTLPNSNQEIESMVADIAPIVAWLQAYGSWRVKAEVASRHAQTVV